MDMDAALKDGYSLAEVNAEAAKRTGFKYENALKDGYSQEEINQELRKRLKAPVSSTADIGTAIKSSLASGINAVDTYGSMLAGAVASPFSIDTADSLYKGMETRTAARDKWANPENLEIGFGGKLAGAVATLPLQMIAAPFSAATSGKTALNAGETLGTAAGATTLDAVGNAAGFILGPGKTLYSTIAKNAGANAAQDYITKWVQQQLMSTAEGRKAFDPTVADAMVSAIVGGATAGVFHPKTLVEKKAGLNLESLKAEKAVEKPVAETPVETPTRRATPQEQATQEALNRQAQAEGVPVSKETLPPEHPTQLELPLTNDITERLAKLETEASPQRDLFEHKQPDVPSPELLKKQQMDEAYASRPQTDERIATRQGQEGAATAQEQFLQQAEEKLRTGEDTGPLNAPSVYTDKIVEMNSGVPFKMEDIQRIVSDVKEMGAFVKGLIETGHTSYAKAAARAKTLLGSAWEGIKAVFQKAWANANERGFNEATRKQGGGVKIDFSKKAEQEKVGEITGLDKHFPELTRAAETPEEVALLAKNSPDIPERGVTARTIGQFTKGMAYERFKTGGNVLVKYVHDTISEAMDASTNRFNELITKQLNPALRSLSNAEYTSLSETLIWGMKEKTPITADMIRRHGGSEKQVIAAEILNAVHKDNFEQLNKSRELAGKKPLEAYDGYITGLAKGDYKTLISIYEKNADGSYKVDAKGNKVTTPVGIVGSNFRNGMTSRVKTLLAQNPDYVASEKMKKTLAKNEDTLLDAVALAYDNNPHYRQFAEALNDILTNEGYSAYGANKHELGKKGIWGMEGEKPWLSTEKGRYENAKDLFDAQISYTRTMGKWAEMSKAVDKMSAVLSDPDVRKQQPNAIGMVEDYIDSALGRNTSAVGKGVDTLLTAIADSMGVGPSVLRSTIALSRKSVNTILLTLNHLFIVTQVIQPVMIMPEMTQFLKGRGINIDIDPMGWSQLATKGAWSSSKHLAGLAETPFEQATWKAAKQYGINQTQLLHSDTSTRPGARHVWATTQAGLGTAIEAGPRAIMFSTFAGMLDAAGHGKDRDVFQVARHLTDLAMVDYRNHEQMKATQHAGMIGEAMGNLTSFHQNTLSRYTMFAKELPKGQGRAVTMALATLVATGGLMALPGFADADWMTTQLSELYGKPTTLSQIVLDMADKLNVNQKGAGDALTMGMGGMWGLDAHHRFAAGSLIPGLSGGMGKLVDVGAAAAGVVKTSMATGPTTAGLDAKLLTKQLLGTTILGPAMEEAWFTQHAPNGREIALNKHGVGTVVRNDADKLFKAVGLTGSHESRTKTQDYAVVRQKQFYEGKQKDVMDTLDKNYANFGGKIPPSQINSIISSYTKAEGNPSTLQQKFTSMGIQLNTSQRERLAIQNKGKTVGQVNTLMRSYAP